ncbi:AAA family ATPase [Tepidimonas sp. HKU77]
MKRKKLPIGIQTFRDIREGGYYYVDKTAFAHRLARGCQDFCVRGLP